MGTLNKQQLRASGPESGIHLVIAGAGTGKTLTLVEKLKNLICTGGYKPENLLVLTFSKKAAEEIRERVRSAIGEPAGFITSGTFHSVALNILRENQEAFLGLSGFSRFPAIMEESDRTRRLETIIMSRIKSFLGFPVPVILHILNSGHRLEPPIQKKLARSGIAQGVEKVLDDYQSMKSSEHLIDFDDMVRWCILILRNNPEVRHVIHEKYRYILVDEFQDTAPDNFELIRLLMPESAPNLFAVGDDWQSIYGFRNARVEYIIKFKKFFPGGKVYPLTINYRSMYEIIKISNRFIKKNRHRTSKK